MFHHKHVMAHSSTNTLYIVELQLINIIYIALQNRIMQGYYLMYIEYTVDFILLYMSHDRYYGVLQTPQIT